MLLLWRMDSLENDRKCSSVRRFWHQIWETCVLQSWSSSKTGKQGILFPGRIKRQTYLLQKHRLFFGVITVKANYCRKPVLTSCVSTKDSSAGQGTSPSGGYTYLVRIIRENFQRNTSQPPPFNTWHSIQYYQELHSSEQHSALNGMYLATLQTVFLEVLGRMDVANNLLILRTISRNG